MSAGDVIVQIKERIDFPDLVAESVALPRRPGNGRPALILCPFHTEKTPSLAIYEDGAHCFGCGWHGDALDWLQAREGLDFRGALEELARRANVDLRPMTPEARQALAARRDYENALAAAAEYFARRLRATPAALDYAHRRGWNDATLQAEGLGYADGAPLPEFGHEQAQQVAEALNAWAGGQGGALLYVHHDGRRVVYLSARAIAHKAHYNPPAALAGERRPYQNAAYSSRAVDDLVLVEGQACAITLGAWGVPALALAGAGMSAAVQVLLAGRTERGASVYLVPDTDGKTNIDALAEALGPELRLVTLPAGVADVNDWSQRGGTAEAFAQLQAGASTWLAAKIAAAQDLRGAARDREFETLLGYVTRVPALAQPHYKREIARALEITARDLERLLKDAKDARRNEHNGNGGARYVIADGCHCAVRSAGGETYTEPLCNFTAEVIEDVARDDGAGTPTRALTVRGRLADGTPLPAGEVEVSKFTAMNWVNELWGVQAVIRAGRDTRDRLREAIQLHNAAVTHRHIYTHTGWREIEDGDGRRRVYLSGNGALGATGVTVELERELSRYCLPLEPVTREAQAEAVRASLRFLEVGPLELTAPLWAAAYLAPLAELVYPDFVLWLYGKTGTLKSTLAALTLCHYGDFDDRALFSWGDTVNRLEMDCFLLKDALIVIDDFAPQSDPFKAREMERNAAQIVRNVGNQAGRGRLKRDLSMAMTYRPRGLVIATGEQAPDGQSIAARIYTLELRPGDVDLERLTAAQAEARLYPQALAGYLGWLSEQWDHLTDTLPEQVRALRDAARATLDGMHLRLPAALAQLYAGMDLGLTYAVAVGALTEAAATDLRARGWEALKTGSEAQAQRVERERPTLRYLEVLIGLLAQGKARLDRRDGLAHIGGGVAGEEFLGWYDTDYLYLLGGPTYNRVARYLRDEGAFFPVKELALRKFLVEERILLTGEDEHNTDVIRVGDTIRRALRLDRARVAELVGELPPEQGAV